MRKRRTREHVIADLSVNHVERFVLRSGHVADRIIFDYGYDLSVRTFDPVTGEMERDFFYVQLKATDDLQYADRDSHVVVRVDPGDIEAWREERVPVLLILYDARNDTAYWTHIQSMTVTGRSSVRIPVAQTVSEATIELLRQRKNQTL